MRVSTTLIPVLGFVSLTGALPSAVNVTSVSNFVEIRVCKHMSFRGRCTTFQYEPLQGCTNLPRRYGDKVSSLTVKYKGADWIKMRCHFWTDDSCVGAEFAVGNGDYGLLPCHANDKLSSVVCGLEPLPGEAH